MTILFSVIAGVVSVTLYVLLSDPKSCLADSCDEGRNKSLFHASIKPDTYHSTKEVFKTLKDAGIEPSFLGADLKRSCTKHDK